MGIHDLVNQVAFYSGFSIDESRDALECMVESLAVRLDESERQEFADQLPSELRSIALSVLPTNENSKRDILGHFTHMQRIDDDRAERQILASWRALKGVIGRKHIDHIRSRLPDSTVELLI